LAIRLAPVHTELVEEVAEVFPKNGRVLAAERIAATGGLARRN
jgi:hypothetical protein